MTGSDERQLHSQATSILRAFKNDRTVTLLVQGVEMALSNRGEGLLIVIVLELTESSTSACHLFAARRSLEKGWKSVLIGSFLLSRPTARNVYSASALFCSFKFGISVTVTRLTDFRTTILLFSVPCRSGKSGNIPRFIQAHRSPKRNQTSTVKGMTEGHLIAFIWRVVSFCDPFGFPLLLFVIG